MYALSQQKTSKPKPDKKPNPSSKKIHKTIFYDPFRYKIQLIPPNEDLEVQNILLAYFDKLRESQPMKPVNKGPEKFISFEKKNINEKLSTLIVKEKFIIGIKKAKQCLLKYMKQQKTELERIPQLIIIFYEEKKHQILENLLCLAKFSKFPYLLLRENKKISHSLGIKNLSALCLFQEDVSSHLFKFIGKCLIEVPEVVDMAFSMIKEKEK